MTTTSERNRLEADGFIPSVVRRLRSEIAF